jgi:predicted transcriptional regulator
MDEEEIRVRGPAFYVLCRLHELCIAMPELASTIDEIGPKIDLPRENMREALNQLASDSLITTIEVDGQRRFYLTSKGIIAACSVFT